MSRRSISTTGEFFNRHIVLGKSKLRALAALLVDISMMIRSQGDEPMSNGALRLRQLQSPSVPQLIREKGLKG